MNPVTEKRKSNRRIEDQNLIERGRNMNKIHYSSKQDDWETPNKLFDWLRSIFPIDLDVCADKDNAKTKRFISAEQNALALEWRTFTKTGCCFMNPPYGRNIGRWVHKAREQSQQGIVVVCLLPARPDTKWFQDICLPSGEILFLKGRVKFKNGQYAAPFPSCIVVFGLLSIWETLMLKGKSKIKRANCFYM